jgi:selenocysteine lyase/cysteine desulfurase
MPAGTRVLSSPVEHHANMLPWRRHDVRLLPFTSSAEELLDACERALRKDRFDLLAVTGASNVTGEIWPVAELAEVAHRHGAELFVDAAQLAPHRPIDMAASGIDHLALSGHKLYAPFGAGALVAASRRLGTGPPLLGGGGAVKLVTLDDVVWEDAPERHEAGSPDVVGVVALAAACRRLHELGMETVAEHEHALAARLWRGLEDIPGLSALRLWPAAERVGVATFTLAGWPHPLLAAILSAEHAIGVRHGCFCAHPLITRLLGVSVEALDRFREELLAGRRPPLPGAVRASIGLGTTPGDIDRLTRALREIAGSGPSWRYRHVTEHDEYEPVNASMGRERRQDRAPVHDEERQSAIHEAVVDGVEQKPWLDRGDRARRERAAEARQRERGDGLGAGVTMRLGHHHRRRDEIGGDDARGRDDRFVGDEPAGYTDRGEGDQDPVASAETVGAEPDRQSEDRRIEDRVRAGHEQAPRGAVGAL